ncbi:MAG: outer membrane beta-barrel protein [Opitutaceae bacterium]|nr:outer membrane beta-barrel protein [Opitutaceae bacterium]
MNKLIRLVPLTVFLPAFAFAVYAPIPEQEQGKALTYRLGASAYHDSNIFGAAAGEIDSMVYNVTGALSYNGSVTDQTFVSGSYELSNDHVADRPGKQNLTNHRLAGRVAHSFSQASNIDLNALYQINKNPESLLSGTTLNTDQSHKRAQFDGRFTTATGQKTGLIGKYRFIDFAYDDATLADNLDRSENLLGVELSYAALPETKVVGEYRFQTIRYDDNTPVKDKDSHFLMGGVDYNPGSRTLISARLGFEQRNRDAGGDTTAPFVELTTRYTYSEGSFLAAGYTHSLEEASDTTNYLDSKVNRLFVNVQHRLSGTFTASGSLTYEPAQLQGRGTVPDADEKTARFGVGLAWQPGKNWTVAGTYDVDDISSDVANREQNRDRIGVSARFTF